MQLSGLKNTRDSPSARHQKRSTLLNWEMVSRSMPVVKRFTTTNARAPSWRVRVYKALSLAQASILDPIKMGFSNHRPGCLRFRSSIGAYHFVRLQETNVIQIVLLARSRSSTSVTSSFACKEPINVIQISLIAFCNLASVLLIRSPLRN